MPGARQWFVHALGDRPGGELPGNYEERDTLGTASRGVAAAFSLRNLRNCKATGRTLDS